MGTDNDVRAVEASLFDDSIQDQPLVTRQVRSLASRRLSGGRWSTFEADVRSNRQTDDLSFLFTENRLYRVG